MYHKIHALDRSVFLTRIQNKASDVTDMLKKTPEMSI